MYHYGDKFRKTPPKEQCLVFPPPTEQCLVIVMRISTLVCLTIQPMLFELAFRICFFYIVRETIVVEWHRCKEIKWHFTITLQDTYATYVPRKVLNLNSLQSSPTTKHNLDTNSVWLQSIQITHTYNASKWRFNIKHVNKDYVWSSQTMVKWRACDQRFINKKNVNEAFVN